MFRILCLLCCKYLVFCAAAAMPPPSLLAVCWPSFNSSLFASHPSYFFVARLMALHRTFWRSEGTQRHLFVFSLQHTVPFFAAFQTLPSSVLEKETAAFSSADAAAKDRKKKRKNCNRKVISSAVFKSTTQKDRQTERKRHSPSTQVQHTHTHCTLYCVVVVVVAIQSPFLPRSLYFWSLFLLLLLLLFASQILRRYTDNKTMLFASSSSSSFSSSLSFTRSPFFSPSH